MKATLLSSLRMAAAAGMLAGALAASAPAAAQGNQTQELLNRLDRMQQEMNTLQRHVYRGEPPPAGAEPAPQPGPQAGGGPSGDRKLVARLSVRINQLESELRRLTGQNEELMHGIRQLQTRLDKLVSDVDFRLGALERGGTGKAPGPDAQAAPPGAPPAAENAPPGAPQNVPGPQVLGQLRTDSQSGQPRLLGPGGQVAPDRSQPQQAAVANETPQQQYDRAHALIVKEQNFAEAEQVLRSFIDKHPKHDLAPNAHYWLGRTYFVRGDFQQAAFTFAEGVQKFPKSDKAPPNLLNLGMSLARLGKEREACTAYARLVQSFPNAEESVKQRVKREQTAAKCR